MGAVIRACRCCSCQQRLRGWIAAAFFGIGLTGWMWTRLHEVLWGGEKKRLKLQLQGTQPWKSHVFLSLASTLVSCQSKDIKQLIMMRKIIATQMMKTLDLQHQGDLHPTWVLRRGNPLLTQRLPCLLCGLRNAWKETNSCSLDSGLEHGAVVTTQSVPYEEDVMT